MGEEHDPVGAALDGCRWAEAYQLLSAQAARQSLAVDDLGRLGTAAYLTGRDEEAFDWWARASQACEEAGDVAGSGRFGVQVAVGLGIKGDLARSRGWAERVRRVLEEAGTDCVELGYLEYVTGMFRIFEDGDLAGARDAFSRAVKIADRFRDRAVRTLGQIGKGRCLIYLGELAEGLSLLDEAMVSVEAREVPAIIVGDSYCTVIDACHELFDLRRCEAWGDSFTRWCDAQPELVLYRGQCLLHRAELLQVHGQWDEAVAFAQEACRRLAEPVNLMTLGGAHYLEAEMHRLRGDTAQAEHAYERAHQFGCEPHPGLSLLRLSEGRLEVAAAAIRRVLAQADGPIGRARVLGPYVEIMLAASDVEAARQATGELASIAAELGSPFLRAQATHYRGAVHLAQHDAAGALVPLRQAAKAWTELRAPYELARTRLVVAGACEALGDDDGAALERKAARATFEELGAAETRRPPGEPSAPGGLTPRELEVLVLVARGSANRAIAEELFISEKTVTSHLTHIFTKLGVASRSAAAAYAYDHGLVRAPRGGTAGRR